MFGTMNKVVANPPIPFVMTIPEGPLQPGHIILLQGNPLNHANRFSVSIVCGPRPDVADYAFHFEARFDLGRVLRKCKLRGAWSDEELISTWKFPFKRDVDFALEIFVAPEKFLVAIDGRHYCEFSHRVAITTADTLQIQGDVKISRIQFKKENLYPSWQPPSSSPSLNIMNPSVPFSHYLNGNLREGKELFIQGKVKPITKRFHVNLQQGSHSYPHPTIAFHFNPRFENGVHTIVMNSYTASWGNEERISHMVPLKPNMEFSLGIKRQSYGYEVSVNGNRMAVFNHRVSPDIVDTVAIDGDVTIFKVMLL